MPRKRLQEIHLFDQIAVEVDKKGKKIINFKKYQRVRVKHHSVNKIPNDIYIPRKLVEESPFRFFAKEIDKIELIPSLNLRIIIKQILYNDWKFRKYKKNLPKTIEYQLLTEANL